MIFCLASYTTFITIKYCNCAIYNYYLLNCFKLCTITDQPYTITDKAFLETDQSYTIANKGYTETDQPCTMTDIGCSETDQPCTISKIRYILINQVFTTINKRLSHILYMKLGFMT